MYSIYNKSMSQASKANKKVSPEEAYLKGDEGPVSWEWYEPARNSLPVTFCLDTSLHGLRYVGQRRRHICERVFWLAAFSIAVSGALYGIYGMWEAYTLMPIVTVFNPAETTIDEIPFPAVTICNVNNVQKTKVDQYILRAAMSFNPNDTFLLQAYAAIINLDHVCTSAKTFMQRFTNNVTWFNFGEQVRRHILSHGDEVKKYVNPSKFLVEGSQKCDEMILLCLWLDEIRNCSELFHEVETDYGYCCTFNTIPSSLLMKYLNDSRDNEEEVHEWREAALNTDNLILTEKTKKRKYPHRQLHAGRSAGLSVMLEPDLKEYYCTNTDSEGFVVALNVPLDFPRMRDRGIAVGTGEEIFIDIRPQVTVSSDTIRSFSLEKRNCYFDKEQALPNYSKYTKLNCMSECIARRTQRYCGCVQYHMPRAPETPLCKSEKADCVERVRRNITQSGSDGMCRSCLSSCTEIEYLAETTSLKISDHNRRKLHAAYPQYESLRDVSVVHVYFGTDSTYSKLRKELYTIIDLVSNTGGILGLCMGFSVLSLLEILYYCTLRPVCRQYRRMWAGEEDVEEVDGYDEETQEQPSQGKKNNNGWFSFRNARRKESAVGGEIRRNNPSNGGMLLPVEYQTAYQNDFLPGYLSTSRIPDASQSQPPPYTSANNHFGYNPNGSRSGNFGYR